MLDKQTIIEKILQVKFNPNQVVTLHEIVDGYTVTVKAMSDELLYFRYKVDEQEKFTSLLDFSLKDGYVSFYSSGDKESQLAKACVLDVLIPILYEMMYNPPTEVRYDEGHIENCAQMSAMVERVIKKAKVFPTIIVNFNDFVGVKCKIEIATNRLTYSRGGDLILGVSLDGQSDIAVYESAGCNAMLNALLTLKNFG